MDSGSGGGGGGGGASSGDGPRFVAEPPNQLRFSNGTGAMLSCVASGHPVPVVTWMTSSDVEIHTLPGIREVIENGSLWLPPFSGHLYSSMVHNTVYRCRASNPSGSIISRECAVIADKGSARPLRVRSVSVLPGNVAVLRCELDEESSHVAEVIWYRKDPERRRERILSSPRYTVTTGGSLHLRDVSIADATAEYFCEHLGGPGGRILSTPGRISVVREVDRDLAPRIEQISTTVTVRVGENVDLECAAKGNPPPRYTWYQQVPSVPLPGRATSAPSSSSSSGVLGGMVPVDGARARHLQSVLQLWRVRPEDGGRYTCVATSETGEDRRDIHLVVTAQLSVRLRPDKQVVDAGGIATFNCSVRGSETGSPLVAWFKDARPLETAGRFRVYRKSHGQDLEISDVNISDRGMYQCIARLGEETSQAASELSLGAVPPQLTSTFSSTTVSSGSPLHLRCVAWGSPPPRVSWKLDGAALAPEEAHVGSAMGSSGEMVATLNISALEPRMGGQYACEARNILGAVTHQATVNVYGQPVARSRFPINVTVVADRDATMRCPVGGFPLTSVRWSLGGRHLPESRHLSESRHAADNRFTVQADGALTIRRLAAGDQGPLTCTAINLAGQAATASVQLHIIKPPVIAPFFFTSKLQAGNRAQVSCSIVDGDLPITIAWRKDGAALTSDSSRSEQTHQFASNLLFSNLAARHSGRYTCLAANAAATANYSADLLVRVPPRWTLEPIDVSIHHGKQTTLRCHATGFPEPKVEWTRLREPDGVDYGLIGSQVYDAGSSEGILHLGPARRQLSGRYQCRATNGVGSPLVKEVSLTVHVPAMFEVRSENRSGAAGVPLTLRCAATGDSPLQLQWTTPDGNPPLLPARVVETPNGGASDLQLSALKRADAGTYRCDASNPFGHDSMLIHLSVDEPPEMVTNLQVADVGSRWLVVQWDAPDASQFIVQYRRVHSAEANSIDVGAHAHGLSDEATPWMETSPADGSSRRTRIESLEPATVYSVRVVAQNRIGAAPPSAEIVSTTLPEAPSKPPTDVFVNATGPEEVTVYWKPAVQTLSAAATVLGHELLFRPVGVAGTGPGDDGFIGMLAAPAPAISGNEFQQEASWAQRTVRGDARQAKIRRLRPFTRYEITVRAFNAVGSGVSSLPVLVDTMEGVPEEAPGRVRCSAHPSPASLRVRWEPSAQETLHGKFQGYLVFYRRETAVLEATQRSTADVEALPSAVPAPGPIQVKRTANSETILDGLSPFTNYSVRLAAVTSAGDGKLSQPVVCSTVEDVPGPPSDIKALAITSQSILVAWTRPAQPNGIIKKYHVYYRVADQYSSKEVQKETIVGDMDRSVQIRRLREFQQLEFWVTAETFAGEGPSTRKEKQAALSQAPARIASFARAVGAAVGNVIVLPCRAVGLPTPDRKWRLPTGSELAVPALSGDSAVSPAHVSNAPAGAATILQEGSLRVGPLNLEHTGNYSCSADNMFGRDEVIYQVHVLRLAAAPALTVSAAGTSSLNLQWTLEDTGGAPVLAQEIRFRWEHSTWKSITIDGAARSHILNDLRCGTRYEVEIAATTSVGRGEASAPVSSLTLGEAPPLPSTADVLVANATAAVLLLASWPFVLCPPTHFVVDLRPRVSDKPPGPWTRVADRALTDRDIILPDLRPASWYEIRVEAYTEAGSTSSHMLFATNTLSGDVVSMEWVPTVATTAGALEGRVPFMVAAGSAIIFVFASLLGFITLRRRCPCLWQYDGYRRSDTATAEELYKQRVLAASANVTLCGEGGRLENSLEGRESVTPLYKGQSSLLGHKGSDGSDYEICPYATFRLSQAGPLPPKVAPTGSYSMQLHTFSQRDCYEEGRPRRSHYGRTQTPVANGPDAAPPRYRSDSPPDGLNIEISCISSQQTLPMSLAMHNQQRRKSAASPARSSRGRSIASQFESDSSGDSAEARRRPHLPPPPPSSSRSSATPVQSSNLYQNRHHRRSKTQCSDSAPELDAESSTESVGASPELNSRGRRSGSSSASVAGTAAATAAAVAARRGAACRYSREHSKDHSTIHV